MDESTSVSAPAQTNFIELTSGIVAAYVSKNSVRPADLPPLLAEVHAAFSGLTAASAPVESKAEKATPSQIRKSITPDALISFVDGKPYKTLKRHLTGAGLTFDEYRERFGLPLDYPTTAANYSAQRSALAKSTGLGQQRRNAATKVVESAVAPAEKPTRARKTKQVAAAAE
ncbi:MucR family transcriptional regulator [Methylobacterium sp. NPDC080182]|uniref:MucR family transcriptional regulator n=1 Tax=Methylobacterium sp. NPDC080182 TaxID=3390590 RepID=UPI003CFE507D